ncbi:MAG: DUF3667 domain-containing protein [Sphingobacteriales bacterium]
MKKHYRTETDCLNCGTDLQGKFCHVCGQENLQMKESFGHMMNHAISDYFHFDQQFFSTLKPLMFKPGFLTNEYMTGRRMSYLHPVKMYIFISVVYFLLLFQSGQQVGNVNVNPKPATKGIVFTNANDKDLDSAKKVIANNSFIPNKAKKEIQKDIDKQKAADKGKANDTVDYRTKPNQWFHPSTKDTSYAEYLVNQKKLTQAKQDGFFERMWNKKVFTYREKFGPGAKDEFFDDLKHNTPKMMFLLLPLFALIVRVSFWKNRKFYVEHLIYTLHLFCFLFMFLGIIILLEMPIPNSLRVISEWLTLLATLYITWYFYRSLRVVYHRSRFRTITKMIGMSFMYFVAFSVCVSLLFITTMII